MTKEIKITDLLGRIRGQLEDLKNTERDEQMKVKIKPLHPEVGKSIPIPKQATELAAGFDVCAAINEDVFLNPGERSIVPCGFSMEIPPGYECQVRPRSGLSIKYGITTLNAPGTIDADYRGPVGVILINLGETPIRIMPGDRIAQLVFAKHESPELEIVDELDDTDRGEGGYGSTGK